MAASVEYRHEEVSSEEIKENDNGNDLSLFVDFSEVNLNLDVLQKSTQIQVIFDPLKPDIKSIMHGQGSGADDFLTSLNNMTDYDWLLSPPRHQLPSPDMEEQISLSDNTLISNGQSTSPESKLENPSADGSSTTSVSPKLPASSSSNGVKPSTTIRRPSPSRKAPSTKPSRSSTPTSRATVTAAMKPAVTIKRPKTPTSRPPVLAATSKSTSRSSTPIQRPSVTASAKSASRSSTPTQRPSVTVPAKSASRSSTPTPRPVTGSAKSASRSSTPTQRPSATASAKSASRSSTPTQRPSVTASAKSALRSSTPTQRPSVTVPAKSASRSSTPTQRNSATVPAKSATRSSTPTKQPSVTASAKSASRSSTPTLRSSSGRVYLNGDDDVNPVLMGTQMVERVVNMRKLAPPRQDCVSDQDNASGKLSGSQDNCGFGRSLSKKSFDMALRHLDIRRSMPGNMRASITKVPASSVYSVRPESTKNRTASASDSDHSEPGYTYH